MPALTLLFVFIGTSSAPNSTRAAAADEDHLCARSAARRREIAADARSRPGPPRPCEHSLGDMSLRTYPIIQAERYDPSTVTGSGGGAAT
ncbi:hypothetical protein NAEX_01876 [Nannocystis exedens]|nr:hypothetical protein NAEX_01876 [Nannocystis exedens]